MTKLDPLEAVAELREYDHAFLTVEGVEHFAQQFGVILKPYRAHANPKAFKGLTLDNGAKSALGMSASVLAEEVCRQLGVQYMKKMGRGFQLRSCCDALERHFK